MHHHLVSTSTVHAGTGGADGPSASTNADINCDGGHDMGVRASRRQLGSPPDVARTRQDRQSMISRPYPASKAPMVEQAAVVGRATCGRSRRRHVEDGMQAFGGTAAARSHLGPAHAWSPAIGTSGPSNTRRSAGSRSQPLCARHGPSRPDQRLGGRRPWPTSATPALASSTSRCAQASAALACVSRLAGSGAGGAESSSVPSTRCRCTGAYPGEQTTISSAGIGRCSRRTQRSDDAALAAAASGSASEQLVSGSVRYALARARQSVLSRANCRPVEDPGKAWQSDAVSDSFVGVEPTRRTRASLAFTRAMRAFIPGAAPRR